jgi:hypothetical protein
MFCDLMKLLLWSWPDVRNFNTDCMSQKPITVAARSEVYVFARSNTGIVGLNPTQGMQICVYSVFVLGSGLVTGWSSAQGVQPTWYIVSRILVT